MKITIFQQYISQQLKDWKFTAFIESPGKEHYGPSFKINILDIPTIHKLIIFMIKDQNAALKEQIDLSKGILLSGPIGCGKISIMHLVRPFASPLSEYKIKTCREISFEFAKMDLIRSTNTP